MSALKVLVAGAHGQLGRALTASIPSGVKVIAVDSADFDVGDAAAVHRAVAEAQPQVIVNAAAYTAVDRAETESALAFRVNRDGAAHLAAAAQQHGARLLQLSTDFVFDGSKGSPYRTDDRPNPLSVYGASKLGGEQAVSSARSLVIRTAWLYATQGNNFVLTMLRLLRERREVRVVADQVGTPTHAGTLAPAIWKLVIDHPGVTGTLHWTDAGVASWYDFAVAVCEIAKTRGWVPSAARVIPIRTEDYPTPARRPPYSVLDKTRTWALIGQGEHWRTVLQRVLASPRVSL